MVRVASRGCSCSWTQDLGFSLAMSRPLCRHSPSSSLRAGDRVYDGFRPNGSPWADKTERQRCSVTLQRCRRLFLRLYLVTASQPRSQRRPPALPFSCRSRTRFRGCSVHTSPKIFLTETSSSSISGRSQSRWPPTCGFALSSGEVRHSLLACCSCLSGRSFKATGSDQKFLTDL
jgi:hypothetical protein